MSKEDVDKVVEYGTRHLELCMELYRMQMRNGLYFLHKHPAAARSWNEEDVMRIANRRDVRAVVGDMCEFWDDNGGHEWRNRKRKKEDQVHDQRA